ncbi:hypothetical protein FE257_008134 [Aspergillus nanangensis]|uniref:Beta-mannosidase n=1 Tax=Aspergillus nanangensis TaxID=2582783 RepID=A0AAD4CLZ1_ASPNN|nr:hypothetical protein FE257_008134 [Aspergillus nanangensis]
MRRYQDAAELSGRFVSEFGMEAYPHLETLRRVITDPQQRHPGSRMMDFQNKAGDHERRIMTYVSANLLVPPDLPSFTHATQVIQAETMRYAYKAWRRMWRWPGARRCDGVLVWQLNNCWPTISWAVVDYYLIRKPAFYAISRALRSLDVGSGELVSENINIMMLASPNATTEVLEHHCVKVTTACDGDLNPFIIHAVISVGGHVVATDTAWPHPLKYMDFSNRNVRVQVSLSSQDDITVSADLPVKGFVFEEREGLKLSDNGFDLVPGEKKLVTVGWKGSATKELL